MCTGAPKLLPVKARHTAVILTGAKVFVFNSTDGNVGNLCAIFSCVKAPRMPGMFSLRLRCVADKPHERVSFRHRNIALRE